MCQSAILHLIDNTLTYCVAFDTNYVANCSATLDNLSHEFIILKGRNRHYVQWQIRAFNS